PFACLEQKASVAIGLRDAARWQQVIDALPTYLDASGLARYFPGEGSGAGVGNAGSPVLTAYLLDVSHAAGFAVPPELLQHMTRGLAAFAEGRIKPEHWSPQADLVVRKLSAIEALTRRGEQPLSAISSLEIEPLHLPTSALIDWYLVVKRLPTLPERAAKLAAVEREIRNRLSFLGGRLAFTSERSDYWWWLMVSGDANTFRLIEAVLDDPAWKDDLPALVQGALLRQQRGRWLTTVANAWASIALEKFGSKFERDAVSGSTRAALGTSAVQSFVWPANPGKSADEANKLLLPWPAKAKANANAGDKLQLSHEGSGKPWVTMQVLAAVPVREPRANGLRVTREVTPVQEKQSGKVSRGDVWRVRLTVESDQEMSWVVVNDPIPGGARILGEGDGRDSHIADMGERDGATDEKLVWPAYVERTFSDWRAYYGYVPRGKFRIDYTLR
ncbi:MAG: alpha-2-macroglobulin, partial [Burkholderiales bacterium]